VKLQFRRAVVIGCVCALFAGCQRPAMQTIPALSSGAAASLRAGSQDLPEPPVVRASHGIASLALTAQIDAATGQPEFVYNGAQGVAPTIEIAPGDTIELNVSDDLPTVPPPMVQRRDADKPDLEMMPAGDADDMNIHFHGLTVSPRKPGDDVLSMLAQPGQSLQYVVHIPKNQEPGLYWYHPHVHGFTNFQVGQSGMSGAIVIDGLERHVRGLASMKQRLIIVRATGVGDGDAQPPGSNTHPCGTNDGLTTSLNGAVKPNITIAPGERQFFRLVNATGHRTLKLAIDGTTLELVALDGYALDTYPGNAPTQQVPSIVVPPAGRAEFVVTGPASGQAKFRTLCFDTGPNGDPDPPLVLATLTTSKQFGIMHRSAQPLRAGTPLPRNAFDSPLPPPAAVRTVVLSEKGRQFFINGKLYRMGAPPMFVVHVGTVEEWHILNVSREIHDFHIHQTHFLVERINGVVQRHPLWRDSVVVPHERGSAGPGAVTLMMDFRDPVIRGEFVFHCHILDHEDKGMMANIKAI
jgi:FtsP/CotA-like multicopper oxidase with cupredoxin domain